MFYCVSCLGYLRCLAFTPYNICRFSLGLDREQDIGLIVLEINLAQVWHYLLAIAFYP